MLQRKLGVIEQDDLLPSNSLQNNGTTRKQLNTTPTPRRKIVKVNNVALLLDDSYTGAQSFESFSRKDTLQRR